MDVVRLVAVATVIVVHTTSLAAAPASLVGGTILVVGHSSREVFLCVCTFVLTYSAVRRPVSTTRFWRRRLPLVAVPYAVWTAIYLAADGHYESPLATTGRYFSDLATAGARYHLYFLLLTIQLYAIFPFLLRLLDRLSARALIALSLSFQLAFTSAIHYRLSVPGPVGTWLTHPGSWLPSYQLYVIGGVLAARHYEAAAAWIRTHGRLVAGATVAAAAIGITSFLLETRVAGITPLRAAAVFQPAVVIESLAFTCGLFCLGLWLARRARPRTLARLEVASDRSFGVYLAHPLVLQGLLAAGVALSILPASTGLSGASVLLAVAVLVPLTYTLTAIGVYVVRPSRVSLALTGRPRAPRPARNR